MYVRSKPGLQSQLKKACCGKCKEEKWFSGSGLRIWTRKLVYPKKFCYQGSNVISTDVPQKQYSEFQMKTKIQNLPTSNCQHKVAFLCSFRSSCVKIELRLILDGLLCTTCIHILLKEKHACTGLTLGCTNKVPPPLWYREKGGGGWWNPPWVFVVRIFSERFNVK